MYMPPLTASTCPVIYDASSDARKHTAAATSAAVPIRPSGICPDQSSWALSVMALEEEFETEIPDEDAEKITTVQQAIDYVKSHSKA